MKPSSPDAARPTLVQRVREAPLTTLLIVINMLVFGFEVSKGDTTNASVLLAAGAVERTHVLMGEWWRLATAMFLHVGIVHLLWNSWAGYGWCAPVERGLGKWKFLFVYLGAGLGGAAASVILQTKVSAGASGAYFGMLGATLILRRRQLPSWGVLSRDSFARQVVMSAVIWTVFGLAALSMDHAAHGGGFVIGAALSWALTAEARRVRVRDTVLALTALAALVVVAVRPWWTPRGQADSLSSYAYGYLTGTAPGEPGTKVLVDYERARRFFQVACDEGSGLGCEYLAKIHRDGLGTPKDDAQALRILEQSCERGDGQACYEEGAQLVAKYDGPETQSIPEHIKVKCVDLSEKACNAKPRILGACVNLAGFYQTGYGGLPQDSARARALYQEACDVGYQDGCAGVLFVDANHSGEKAEREAAMAKLRTLCKVEGSWLCQLLRVSERALADGD